MFENHSEVNQIRWIHCFSQETESGRIYSVFDGLGRFGLSVRHWRNCKRLQNQHQMKKGPQNRGLNVTLSLRQRSINECGWLNRIHSIFRFWNWISFRSVAQLTATSLGSNTQGLIFSFEAFILKWQFFSIKTFPGVKTYLRIYLCCKIFYNDF